MKSGKERTIAYYRIMRAVVALTGILLVILVLTASMITDHAREKKLAEEESSLPAFDLELAAALPPGSNDATEELPERLPLAGVQTPLTGDPENEASFNETAYDFSDVLFVGDEQILSISHGGMMEYRLVPDDSSLGRADILISDDDADDIIKDAANRNTKYVFFCFGQNDARDSERISTDVFIANYNALLKTFEAGNKRGMILVVSALYRKNESSDAEINKQNETVRRYNAALKKLCKENGYTYIELNDMVSELDYDPYYSDGIHYVERFYKENYLPTLMEAIGQ